MVVTLREGEEGGLSLWKTSWRIAAAVSLFTGPFWLPADCRRNGSRRPALSFITAQQDRYPLLFIVFNEWLCLYYTRNILFVNNFFTYDP
jgi:hypothetical protein